MNDPVHPEEAIFQVALEMPASERRAYLDQACAGDGALQQRVEQLVAVSWKRMASA